MTHFNKDSVKVLLISIIFISIKNKLFDNGSLCYLSMLTDATPLQPTYPYNVSEVFGAELREVFT